MSGKHAQLIVALARKGLVPVFPLWGVSTGCIQSVGLRRACQRALSKFCPNGALFQLLVQTGTVLPSGSSFLSGCRKDGDAVVSLHFFIIPTFLAQLFIKSVNLTLKFIFDLHAC